VIGVYAQCAVYSVKITGNCCLLPCISTGFFALLSFVPSRELVIAILFHVDVVECWLLLHDILDSDDVVQQASLPHPLLYTVVGLSTVDPRTKMLCKRMS
jgi:hypothetical protein